MELHVKYVEVVSFLKRLLLKTFVMVMNPPLCCKFAILMGDPQDKVHQPRQLRGGRASSGEGGGTSLTHGH